MATMRNVGGGAPLIPVEEIDYSYDIPIISTAQLWSVDIPLGQAVDPSRHVAVLHCSGSYYPSSSTMSLAINYFVEIVDTATVRLTIQGSNVGVVWTNNHVPIGIYKFGVKPKHSEAAMYNNIVNGQSGNVTLSRPYDLKRSVLFNAGSSYLWQDYVKWLDAQTLYCNNRHSGAFVAEF